VGEWDSTLDQEMGEVSDRICTALISSLSLAERDSCGGAAWRTHWGYVTTI
jgi:hypothetical protein